MAVLYHCKLLVDFNGGPVSTQSDLPGVLRRHQRDNLVHPAGLGCVGYISLKAILMLRFIFKFVYRYYNSMTLLIHRSTCLDSNEVGHSTRNPRGHSLLDHAQESLAVPRHKNTDHDIYSGMLIVNVIDNVNSRRTSTLKSLSLFFSFCPSVQFRIVPQYRPRVACEAEDVGASPAKENAIQVGALISCQFFCLRFKTDFTSVIL